MAIQDSTQQLPDPPARHGSPAPRRQKPDVWLPFYFGDYIKATGHLTCVEHGAYMLLMFTAWQSGGPLPADHERLRVISKMEKKDWKNSKAVILAFFYEKDGEIRHKRIDTEWANAERNIKQKSAAGRASAAKKAEEKRRLREEEEQRKVNETSTAVATEGPTEPPRNANPSPSPSPSPSPVYLKEENIPPTPKPAGGEKPGRRGVWSDADFDAFWKLYPRKVAKPRARKAFFAATRKVTVVVIMQTLARSTFSPNIEHCPYPATWLNDERWSDEDAVPASTAPKQVQFL